MSAEIAAGTRVQILEDVLYYATARSRSCAEVDRRLASSVEALEREDAALELQRAIAKLHARLGPVASSWLAELPPTLVQALNDSRHLPETITDEVVPMLFSRAGLGDDLVSARRPH